MPTPPPTGSLQLAPSFKALVNNLVGGSHDLHSRHFVGAIIVIICEQNLHAAPTLQPDATAHALLLHCLRCLLMLAVCTLQPQSQLRC